VPKIEKHPIPKPRKLNPHPKSPRV